MTEPGTQPLRVGLVGAGPWAQMVHAPMLAAHAGTDLVGIWARRSDAAAALAAEHGSIAYEDYDALLEQCDAVSFAVPPDVQAEYAMRAARKGKALSLDKPIALDLAAAQRFVDVVDEAGVGTQVLLTWRYSPAVREFLTNVASAAPIGGRGCFIAGGALGGPFVTPWRQQHGALLDLGPHVIDLMDAALGPVVGIRAHGDPLRWVGLLLEHESGVVSEASISAHTAVAPPRTGAEIYTRDGVIEIDATGSVGRGAIQVFVEEFVTTARTGSHPLDIHRGLHLQRWVEAAARQLEGGA